MIPISSNTIIYVACPPQVSTGGPELLHQFCAALKTKGYLAYMYYLSPDGQHKERPVHPEYAEYSIEYLQEIIDDENNVLVLPETMVLLVNTLNLKRVRKCIWWLSIDNFFKPVGSRFLSMHPWLMPLKKMRRSMYFSQLIKNKGYLYHLAQSYYAQSYLYKKGIESTYVSDYINDNFFNISSATEEKEDIVLYNPKKGKKFTKQLMEAEPSLNWKPLINLTRQEVIQLLTRAKVYIDFGEHPGKDRFPREAAIMHCCIITGLDGSASFSGDVAISDKFKFKAKPSNINGILDTIRNCVENYEIATEEYNKYREIIKSEKGRFYEDIGKVFIR